MPPIPSRSHFRPRTTWGLTTILTIAALGTGPSLHAQDTEPKRPKTQFLRQNEDWSGFRAGDEASPFDKIKHVAVSRDAWLSFGGRIDARAESWDGFGFGATTPGNKDTFLLSRAILHADLHVGDRFRIWVEGKTAHVLGRDRLPGQRRTLDLDTLALHQAFADYRFGDDDGSLRVRVGRQGFLFGAQRLVSPLPWANTLRTWDGVSALYRTGQWSVTGFATYFVPVQKREFNDSNDDLEFYGVYATRAPEEGGRGYDLYVLGNSRPNVTINGTTGNERRHTIGGRTWGPLGRLCNGNFDGEFEGAYQFGDVGPSDVGAWSLTGVLGYRPDDWRWSPRFFAGIDAASGDGTAGGDVDTFHQLFPLGHAFLGLIDAVGRQNILAFQAGAQLKVADNTKVTLAGHVFRLMDTDDALYNVGGGVARTGLSSSDVGQEIDLLIQHKVDRHLSIYGGYSHLFAGDGIAASGPDEDQSFLYAGFAFVF